MTDVLPILERLFDCESHAERAGWLLTVPLSLLLREEMQIRLALRQAGFLAGIDYLDCELSGLRSVRRDEGCMREGVVDVVVGARRAMWDVVREAISA